MMGIPLESAKSFSDKNSEGPRLPNTAGKSRKTKASLTSKQSQKKSGRLASDSIGHYLSSIGRVPLLTPAEEIELAHHVQNIKNCCKFRKKIEHNVIFIKLRLVEDLGIE
uniref:Type II alternative RNA polymerase sigma factor, sigma-70 family n=1 Tax=uncultured Prochlorococcus marinus clone HOT0M-3E5 TaxID=379388 RepID=Q1PJF4_PROMR|nr:type II alternative RNA polymerase sigma factor, sigma-70 family [uncultured Prochlorococcus marinus clone HOT0M-3E5]